MMLAENTEQYVKYANRLIRDVEFRRKVGRAARRFMDLYFHDSGHMGQIFGEHIAEVIADSKQHLPSNNAEQLRLNDDAQL